MGRSRRTKRSNRRLPNSSRSPDNTKRARSITSVLRSLSDRPSYEDLYPSLRKRQYSQLAKNVNVVRPSTFPKVFRGLQMPSPSLTPTKSNNTPLKANICVSRTIRSEVMHATGKAGKRGQKSPIWKKSSKVRC